MVSTNISTVFLCGLTCVGKTTLARQLSSSLRCDIVYIGEILRAEYSPQRISHGDIPSEEFFPHIQKKINQRTTSLIIIDNFPNNMEQYNIWLKHYSAPIITLHIKSKNVFQRKLIRGRADDNHVNTMSRYLKFQKYTIPVIEYLKKNSFVAEISGDQPPRKVLEEAINLIRGILINKRAPFYDFSTPVVLERLNVSAKTLIKNEPFKNGYKIFLPSSINIAPFKTESHSTATTLEVGARSTGFLTGTLAEKGILVHPSFIDPGASELKIVLTNLSSDSILINADSPIAEIIFLPTLLPTIIEAETVKYGF